MFRPPGFGAAGARRAMANAIAKQVESTEGELPGVVPAKSSEHTEIYTYFTKPGIQSRLMYSAEDWTMVRLTLENAGPVAVGTMQEIGPVLSGKGALLPTGREREFNLARGDRLYIVASAVNRVTVMTSPVPFLRRITLIIEKILKGFRR